MISRCHNPRSTRFGYYGERGIKVCQRWRDDFEAFVTDMGPRPAAHTLDRIDNDGDYSPENCRWASRSEQQRNTSRTRWVFWNGKAHRLVELAQEHRIDVSVLALRIERGWSMERALGLDMGPQCVPETSHPTWALTPRQLEVLRVIDAYIKANGYPPSLRELKDLLGISSTNGVNDFLRALERKGRIVRVPMTSRAIRLTTAAAKDLAGDQAPDGVT